MPGWYCLEDWPVDGPGTDIGDSILRVSCECFQVEPLFPSCGSSELIPKLENISPFVSAHVDSRRSSEGVPESGEGTTLLSYFEQISIASL